MKKRIGLLLFVLIVTLVIIIGVSHSSKYHLEIPTAEYIEKNGYPTNRNGETYGPQIKDTLDSPDLILAENSDGLKGYVKRISVMRQEQRKQKKSIYLLGKQHITCIFRMEKLLLENLVLIIHL